MSLGTSGGHSQPTQVVLGTWLPFPSGGGAVGLVWLCQERQSRTWGDLG